MHLTAGAMVGHYEVEALLGRGGMGEVYRARDLRLGRHVAIKVLNPERVTTGDLVARFHREARVIAGLTHPHIARLYDAGEEHGLSFLVMECLHGEPLSTRLRNGALSLADALSYAADIADALHYAHARSVVHGDVKPANIFLTGSGATLLDFGVATVAAGGDEVSTVTGVGAGIVAGTYPYMSPEQLKGLGASARSDVFALGAVMFEMIAGRRAFRGDSVAAVATAILYDAPVALPDHAASVPGLDAVVERCLAKNPLDRWQTAAELRDRLADLQHGGATLALTIGQSNGQRRSPASPKPFPLSGIRAAAVLPLRNLSPDHAEEYLVDGLTESLITALTKIGAFRVISRTSTMRYKGSDKPLHQIAEELKVEAILEGSVTHVGHRVAIDLRLVNVATDDSIWAEHYSRDPAGIFDVLDDVVRSVADTVRVGAISPGSPRRRFLPAAHDEYLQGQFALSRFTKDSLRAAFDHFSRAVALDPSHALAQVGLALYFEAVGLYRLVPYREAFASGTEAAQAAIALDGALASAYAALGSLAAHSWDLGTAHSALSQALDLDANDVLARQVYARCYLYDGRFDDAIEQIEIAQELDPQAPRVMTAGATIFYVASRFTRAIASADHALALAPDRPDALYYRARALAGLGDRAAALQTMLRAVDASGRHPATVAGLAFARAACGEAGEAEALVAELEHGISQGTATPFNLAEAYVAVERNDAALRALEAAYEQRDPELNALAVDPVFAPLRNHVAFRHLTRRIGLH